MDFDIVENSTLAITEEGVSDTTISEGDEETTEFPSLSNEIFGKLMEGDSVIMSEALTAENISSYGFRSEESSDATETTYDWRELFEEFKLTEITTLGAVGLAYVY